MSGETRVVIIGGGIQGVSLAWAARRYGVRPIVVERGRVGEGATGNSYGIIHGGLRYLQTLDITRWKRSRQAQAWYSTHFPEMVRPVRCVMPLYRHRLRSPAAFRVAGRMERTLGSVLGVASPLAPPGLMKPVEELYELPIVKRGLVGAAVWHDMQVDDTTALLRSMIQDAELDSGYVREGTEAIRVLSKDGRAIGVELRDSLTETTTVLDADLVVNCAGSWSARVCAGEKPHSAVLAFNLLLDATPFTDAALAVSEKAGRGRSYFVRPRDGGVFAGTYYRPAPGEREPHVRPEDVAAFRAILARALPDSGLAAAPIRRIMAGLLPDEDGTGRSLASADHVVRGDIENFVTVLGGKLTTAPLLSEDVAASLWSIKARN
jgi:glycerol-3-phosphate dehydrogenase